MAESISSELVSFKDKVGSCISSMNTTVTNLSMKLDELSSISTSTQTSISSVYSSENKETVLGKFDSINNIYKKLSASLESDMTNILKESSALLEKITNLENIRNEIVVLEGNLSSSDSKVVESANSSLISKRSEFNTLHSECKSLLNKLKTMDSNLSFVEEFSVMDMATLAQYLTGGTFEKKYYTASNGIKVEYYIYVPEYSIDVDKIPVHMYLHGAGEDNGGVLDASLPEMLQNGYEPNGIVICPQNTFGGGQFEKNEDFQDALIELTNKTIETYSGDPDRVSLSGHSAGAIGGYRLIARYPDYFSAFIPISGHADRVTDGGLDDAWDSISQVNVWAFHGALDESVKYSAAQSAIEKLRSMGSENAELYTFEKWGHGEVQNLTFEKEYSYQGGEPINPLDWAFNQTKNG